ncbi:MAG: ABC-2 family transporter protein [Gemmataceae bacterium]|nr:ABC-2 family transporter protein [Gemmataceae bacterium]
MARYFRLWFALARFSLQREMAFRANFLVKIFVEVLWLSILLLFYNLLFQRTATVKDWTHPEYLFFVGCYFTFQGMIESLFLENCNQFADLVRTGDLDFYLLRPIDEQFLVSLRTFDWSCLPNVAMGVGVMCYGLSGVEQPIAPGRVVAFIGLLVSGVGLAYGFLLMLTSLSVWFMRNQSLLELWWLFTALMRYPREIFDGPWASPFAWLFSFVVPIMLVTNVPARVMVKPLEQPALVGYALAASVAVMFLARRVFRAALRRYRSASS